MADYGPLRASLLKALKDALPASDVAEVAANLGGPIEDIAPANATRPQQIAALVQWAEASSLEVMLVREAMEQNKHNAELNAIGPAVLEYLRRNRPWYSSPDPIETCIVSRDQAFVDRLELRQRLQQLMQSNGWRSLVVKGEKRSGRSFTLELITFVIGDEEDSRIVLVDLADTGADLGPGDLVRKIAFQMGLESVDVPPQQEQAPKWNEDLSDWLGGQVENSGRTCWLIIDAIDAVRPRDETMDLIWKLAATAKTRPRLRVVLLGCSEPPPAHVKALEEEIKPIDRDMVEAFFTLFYEHKGVAPNDTLVRRATDTALRPVPNEGDDRLEVLQQEVTKVARTIAEGMP